MDTYFEYMVKRKKNIGDVAYILIIALLAVALIYWLLALSTTPIASLVFPLQALVVYLSYLAIIQKNIEFEYCLTGDTLDIDKIINKQKRKTIDSINIKKIISMAPTGSSNLPQIKGKKIVNATSGTRDKKIYCIIYGENKAFFFEPKEDMVEQMKKINPRNIFVD